MIEAEEHARARGARIRAVLAGYGASGDATHMAAPDESGRGASQCMQAALADAGRAPEDVGYVNAHATSTPAGDRGRGRGPAQRSSATPSIPCPSPPPRGRRAT